MSGVTWVHLSDWHQGEDSFDRTVVRDALKKDLEERNKISPELDKIDFVLFTGDLAFSGRTHQFEAALENFIKPVLKACGLENRLDLFFIVPGNHDVNRETIRFLRSDTHFFRDRELLTESLGCTQRRKLLLAPLWEYAEFVKANRFGDTCSEFGFTACLADLPVTIIGLNSSWLSGTSKNQQDEVDDYGKLLVGEPQTYAAVGGRSGKLENRITIGMLHHPPSWLAQDSYHDDRIKVRNFLAKHCDVVVHGHEHEPHVNVQRATYGETTYIPAGSAYNRRDPWPSEYANSYNICHINFETGKGEVHMRRFDGNAAWMPDVQRAGQNGKFPLDQFKNMPGPGKLDANTEAPQSTNPSGTISSTKVSWEQPDSPPTLSSDRLKENVGGIAVGVYVHPVGEGIRQPPNNRYVFAHAGTPEPPYRDVLALCYGPRDFTTEGINDQQWKVWLCNQSQPDRDFCIRVQDNLDVGWNSFAVTWTRPGQIQLWINGETTGTASGIEERWPREFADKVFVGAWPKKWKAHFANTCVADYEALESLTANAEAAVHKHHRKVVARNTPTDGS